MAAEQGVMTLQFTKHEVKLRISLDQVGRKVWVVCKFQLRFA